MDVRRGAAKLPHAVSLARFGRLRSVTFRHEHYVSSIPTGELDSCRYTGYVPAIFCCLSPNLVFSPFL